jgi:putative copper resistance protein D
VIWLLKDFDLLSVLLRAASLSLEACTLGGLLFLLIAALPAASNPGSLEHTRRIASRFAVALALVQAASVGLSVAILMGGSGFTFPALVSANFFVAGTLEIAGTLLLALLLRLRSPWSAYAALLPAAVVLGASVAQSHGASRMEDRGLLMGFTALHHLGTAGWVGAMLFLLLALRTSLTLGEAQTLARRYSAMALVSVPLLVLAGVGMSWFYVGSWAGLYGTTYGVMVLAKTYLLLAMLLLGAGNYRLLRPKNLLPSVSGGSQAAHPQPFLLRLRRFSEAEIGLGITAILAAASLTSQPPAIDLQQDRLSMHEIVERMRPEPPLLTSPPVAQLSDPGNIQAAVESAQFSAGAPSDASGRAWSEYNHHWAGLIVLACALLAFASRALPRGRLRSLATNWPLLFIALAMFIVLRADAASWPLGPQPFWASFAFPDVLEHRLYAVLITCFAIFEWAVATGRWRSPRAAYVFPLLCAAGGAALLTHSHGLSNVKDEMLAELAHTPIAVMGATAGSARWLQLRLPGTRAARIAGLLWPVCLALSGLFLLDYRES